MTFKHAPFNTTKQHTPKGVISGKRDAIFLRNKYQTEVDNAWASIVNMVHYCEDENKEVKEAYREAAKLKHNIEAHQAERADLYQTLGNLLNKETDFESKMWKETQKKQNVKSITIKQKFNDSDVDEMRYDAMLNYLQKYPEYASKSSFKKVLDKIEEKEREIRQEKQYYNRAVSHYNYKLSFVLKHIKKAEDKIDVYQQVLKEGEEKLAATRYRKGVLFKFASEETRAKVTLDTLQHRVKQFQNTLDALKNEYANIQSKPFEEMSF